MKKVVLFDIDYTLFDTDLFKESDLKNHSVYEEVLGVLVDLSTVATLGIFSEGNIELQKDKLLKTDMSKHFNQENVHIFEEKTKSISSVLEKYKGDQIFIVDDRPVILEKVKKQDPSIFTIFINREKRIWRRDESTDYQADAVIYSLTEIIPLVNN